MLLAMFAFAAATVITTSNAHGEGRAVDGDGHRATFHFDTTRVAHNDHAAIRGSFQFTAQGATDSDSMRVSLEHVTHMSVVDNVATFGGDGSLRVQHGHDVHTYRGSVSVVATSNTHPGEGGSPDTIAVNFLPAVQTDPSFSFTGNVTAGDIAVTTTLSY
jgi:hypothetical protein